MVCYIQENLTVYAEEAFVEMYENYEDDKEAQDTLADILLDKHSFLDWFEESLLMGVENEILTEAIQNSIDFETMRQNIYERLDIPHPSS